MYQDDLDIRLDPRAACFTRSRQPGSAAQWRSMSMTRAAAPYKRSHPQKLINVDILFTRRTAMKQLLLLGISLLAVAACSPPAPPPAVAGQPITAVNYASGSSANTTRAFDGTFTGLAVQGVAGGSITPGASTASINCPNYTVSSLPPVTISNGLAQFQAIGLTFQGFVTPQGILMMNSGVGQTFQGQIDSRNVLSGQVLGRCAYNLSWQKSA
jgi:hypothetical protein